MGDSLGARLGPLTALDERGVPVTLGGFWAEKPAVVSFVRHFG